MGNGNGEWGMGRNQFKIQNDALYVGEQRVADRR
jgi:hypothetical protein